MTNNIDNLIEEENIDTNKVYEFVALITYPIYYNKDSYFGIYEFSCIDKLPCTNTYVCNGANRYTGCLNGNMQELFCETEYKIKARLKYNNKYKKYDYNVESITCEQPKTETQQKFFLESICTKRQAGALLKEYPNIVEDVMNGKSIDVNSVSGIGEKTFNSIKEKILDNYIIQDILVLLKPLGVTFTTIKKLIGFETNPSLLKQKIIENPYILTSVHGLGFKKVDDLALKLAPQLRVSLFRVKAYLSYKLKEIANSDGHTWIYKKDLIGYVRKDLRECIDIYNEFIESETENPTLLNIEVDDERIGLLSFHKLAQNIVEQLYWLDGLESMIEPFTEDEINEAIKVTEDELGFSLTDEQKEAIKSVNDRNVIIVTAPAGAGKTTAIKGIFSLLSKARIKEEFLSSEYNQIHEEDKMSQNEFNMLGSLNRFAGLSAVDDTGVIKVGQCALSAKAAKRMKEVSGQDAITMHRMLGYDGNGFAYKKDFPMKYHVNVFDEVSMVNKSLINSYLNAIRPHSKLILIFDYAQLPPIGSGDFTRDILNSNLCINKFTKVHRQGEDSGILMDANYMRVGKNPIPKLEKNIVHGKLRDMFYRFEVDKEKIRDLAITCYLKSVQEVGLDEAVIVTPRKHKCINSALELNKIIQDKLISNSVPQIPRWKDGEKCIFKLGAKIMQKKNNYDKGVFNGDEGYISFIDIDNKKFCVNFSFENGVKEIEYNFSELIQIELSYAISIHSAQGSQYHSVICVFDYSSFKMLNRKILYTAVTRAKKKCMLITEPKAFQACLNNINNVPRNTYLSLMFQNNK